MDIRIDVGNWGAWGWSQCGQYSLGISLGLANGND